MSFYNNIKLVLSDNTIVLIEKCSIPTNYNSLFTWDPSNKLPDVMIHLNLPESEYIKHFNSYLDLQVAQQKSNLPNSFLFISIKNEYGEKQLNCYNKGYLIGMNSYKYTLSFLFEICHPNDALIKAKAAGIIEDGLEEKIIKKSNLPIRFQNIIYTQTEED